MTRSSPVLLVVQVAVLATPAGCRSGALPTWDETTLEAPAEGPTEANADTQPEATPGAADDAKEDAPPAGEGAAPANEPGEVKGTEPAPKRETAEPAAKKRPKALPKPLYGKADAACGKGPGIGRPLASFSLPSPGGKTISPRMYRGRVLLVNFWGTWCKPCLEELPAFDRLYRRYRAHGLTLLAVATDEDPAPVRDFVQRKKLAAKVVYKGEGEANRYGSDRFPFTFVVDSKGVIVASYRGYEPRCMGQLEADLRAALEARGR